MDYSPEEREKAIHEVASQFVGMTAAEAMEPIVIMEVAIDRQLRLNAAVDLLRRTIENPFALRVPRLADEMRAFLADFPVPVETKR